MATQNYTSISAVLQSQAFKDYVSEAIVAKNNFINSGIAYTSPELSALISNDHSMIVEMPFWKPFSGDSAPMSESAMDVSAMTGAGQVAVKLLRQKAVGFTDLAQIASGDNLTKVIGNQIVNYWNHEIQKIVISELTGLFANGGALASSHLMNKSNEVISSQAILDAKQLLGDSSDNLTAIVMHSAVKTKLEKLQLIQYVSDATNTAVRFPTYMGYRVIIDDSCPVNNGVYDTYIFGNGAFGIGLGNQAGVIEYETARDALSSKEAIITRKALIVHPYGLKYKGQDITSTSTPTNANLATANKWQKVYENKNIAIVCLRSRIEQGEESS